MPAAQVVRNPMRARFREQVREDVKAAALCQLAAGGAQAISVNAIAKQLGVSGPALYRYFANRDALLTALVVDAYVDFRDALARAVDDAAGGSPDERLRALAGAYRAWALAAPHRYELLFKPPLPGYDAHAEPLVAAAQTVMEVVVGVMHEKVLADHGADHGAGPAAFQRSVTVWSRLHGIVSLELGGNFAAMQLDADALYDREVDGLLDGTRQRA